MASRIDSLNKTIDSLNLFIDSEIDSIINNRKIVDSLIDINYDEEIIINYWDSVRINTADSITDRELRQYLRQRKDSLLHRE